MTRKRKPIIGVLLLVASTQISHAAEPQTWNWVYSAPSRVSTIRDRAKGIVVLVRYGDAQVARRDTEIDVRLTDLEERDMEIRFVGQLRSDGEVKGILTGLRYDQETQEPWVGQHSRLSQLGANQSGSGCMYEEIVLRPALSLDGAILPNGNVLVFVRQQSNPVCD